MDEKQLKEEFIKYFGEEKWKQEEMLGKLQKVVFEVCERWLFINPISILFSDDIGTDEARYDLKEQVIWLNTKNQNNFISLLDCVLHELEHLYQHYYISSCDTPKARRWKKEFENYIADEDPFGNLTQEIEIDAMAFSQLVLQLDYGIRYEHSDPIIQELINRYLQSEKMLSDD